MKKLIIGAIAAATFMLGSYAVSAAPDVTLSGQHFLRSDGNDVIEWHFDGNWSGRDLAIHQVCDNGDDTVYRFGDDGISPKSKGGTSVLFANGATECSGVTLDLVDALNPASWVEVSNTVIVAIP